MMSRQMRRIVDLPTTSSSLPSSSSSYTSCLQRRRCRGKVQVLVPVLQPIVLLFLSVFATIQRTTSSVQGLALNLNCTPCIDRNAYTIQAIVHGNPSTDPTWKQSIDAFQQLSDSLGINIIVESNDTSSSSVSTWSMSDKIQSAMFDNVGVDAIIVTIPNDEVAATLEGLLSSNTTSERKATKPVFGFNVGGNTPPASRKKLLQLLDGYIGGGDDDPSIGELAAYQFLQTQLGLPDDNTNNDPFVSPTSTNTSTTRVGLIPGIGDFTLTPDDPNAKITSLSNSSSRVAIYVESLLEPDYVVESQYTAFARSLRGAGIFITQNIQVNPFDPVEEQAKVIELLFQGGCPYSTILLNSKDLVSIVLDARLKYNCTSPNTNIGVTQVSADIYNQLTLGNLLFAIDAQQIYFQTSLVTLLTSIYVSTGLKLPLSTTQSLVTGPIIYTRDNVPSDSIASCQNDAFPICSTTSERRLTIADNSNDYYHRLLQEASTCQCSDRKQIRIAGVVHGVTTDSYWDPVFAMASQAAIDMGGITLLMDRFDPETKADDGIAIEYREEDMAAKITSLCQSGIDGIFVSIPSSNISSPIVKGIRECQSSNIPIISINSGYSIAQQIGIPYHVATDEYQKGYDAGLLLVQSGMKYGFCLDHEPGNDGIQQRCLGFQDSIEKSITGNSTVKYMGHYPVPFDNDVKYMIDVEAMVSSSTIPAGDVTDSWAGIGLLLTGEAQIESFRAVKANHTAVLAGTFDTGKITWDALRDNVVIFTSDQQAPLQGSLPIYLLTYLVAAKQALIRPNNGTLLIDTGKTLVTETPDENEIQCAASSYEVCEVTGDSGNVDDDNTSDVPPNIKINTTETNIFVPNVDLRCAGCIDRTQYSIAAIMHGLDTDSDWIQIRDSMIQAATSMRVKINVTLQQGDYIKGATYVPSLMAQQIMSAAADPTVNALIVSIPDGTIQQTIIDITQQYKKPVFGINVGYQLTHALGLQGYIGQNDFEAGQVAAKEFQKHFVNSTFTTAAFVYPNKAIELTKQYQLQAFTNVVGSKVSVTEATIDLSSDVTQYNEEMNALFTNCPYQAVLLSTKQFVASAIEMRSANGCSDTQIGVVGVNDNIYESVTQKSLLFAIDQELFLQGTSTVILAALFITTGKKLSIPRDSSYLSRAVVVGHQTVPSDSKQTCQENAFPYCSISDDEQQGATQNQTQCECGNRKKIRIAAVLHGHQADRFWDPVYAGIAQAGSDMDVQLDVDRPQQPSNVTLFYQQMAAKIGSYCGQAIDGLVVTLPDPIVVEAVQNCRTLNIPVISINSGEKESEKMGLYHHIAQAEFSAGYEAALKLAESGMKYGFCLNHAPGVSATLERCNGFQTAIEEKLKDQVAFMGSYEVAEDNKAQFDIDVNDAVSGAKGEWGVDWEGIGILVLGSTQAEQLEDFRTKHPKFIAGTFDVGEKVTDFIAQGWMKFGIDQQPFLQGNLPVYLLTYIAIANGQALRNQKIESGPSFIEEPPSEEEATCAASNFKVCPDAPEENMNYIGKPLLAFGYTMFGVIATMCATTGVWVFVNRNEWVVKVGQPPLLGLVIIGCFISSLSIIFIGIQTGYPRLQDPATRLPIGEVNPDINLADASCMAFPWLYGMGFVLTFSSLFAKIHRVKMIYRAGMRMQRKTIGFKDVAYIGAFLFLIELSILVTWQLVSPLRWERTAKTFDDNEFPLSSVGGCTYEEGWYFFAILVGFHVLCLFYALALCFQTKDINSDFAESSYISLAVAFMFQVLVLSVPICALVQSLTPVFYFIRVLSIFLQNFTVMALMFIPKVIKQRNRPKDGTRQKGDGYQINGRSMIQSRLSMAPGDPSRTLLMSDQMQNQMAIQGFQGLSDSTLRKSGSALQHHLSEELFLSEVSDERPERKPSSKFSDSILSRSFALNSVDRKSVSGSGATVIADAKNDNGTDGPQQENSSYSNGPSDWEALGFQSLEQAKNVAALLSKDVSADERQQLLLKMLESGQGQPSHEEEEEEEDKDNDIEPNENKLQVNGD